ncbi:M81 family metallopeptidase [Hydrogenophaga sp.]|uniref:M81 family metallopeptidase n=1 Tax=Hydrogenophaga sp. TaxID=1904254 RepID=UPI0026361B8F|nr:M81 family metallopeptidase [Hydrogenophaga sp.]MDM7950607.1 M81 family metallopeptidase [Hydrogenophaga sp.]
MGTRLMPKAPRIGLAGFFLEANRLAPVTTGAHFEQSCDRAGAELLAELRAPAPRLLPDSQGFVATMGASGDWEPVALRMALAYPGGPVDHVWWTRFLADVERRLAEAGPLDGVFISSHGAALTTEEDDPDGVLFERIRALVGPNVPVVAVFDLHTNVSRRMTDALSAFVAYRTNPHVDLRERGAEAAVLMRRMLVEGPGVVVLEKLPFLPASTDQLIAPGSPYARLLDEAAAWPDERVLNISLCGGFPLADCAKCGFSVVVTASRGARDAAQVAATGMARRVWDSRKAFLTALTPMDTAVAMAVDAGADPTHLLPRQPRLILADVGDNPGGGGGGNTTALLSALLKAGAKRVLLGVFTDPLLAARAHQEGVGAWFLAHFNAGGPPEAFADPLDHEARVLALSDGTFVGRKGLVQGSTQSMGSSALLSLGGVQVIVISQRQQLLDPAQLDIFGIDLAQSTDSIRTLVVKSRGHFRAAFSDFAPAHRVIEVDGPGLTTPVLSRLSLQRVPRPAFPLDADAQWPPD